MEVEETGEKRTSWYDTFCIYYASTLGCDMLQIGAEKYPCWLIVLFCVCHQHDYKTYLFVRHVEQKLILMHFARARRINKSLECTLPT